MALRDRIFSFQKVANAKAANPAYPRQPAGGGELAGLAELALAKPRRENLQRPALLPGWCRPSCPNFRRLELHGHPPVVACYRVESPTRWTWTRLDKLTGCPLAKSETTPPPPPAPISPPPTTGPEVSGLPCGGCGSTSYRLAPSGFRYPDGTLGDGWHCGTPGCHVKLLTGIKTVDHLPLLHQTESEP